MVHVPKTIDNDYRGIDFTFGLLHRGLEGLASGIRNLLADAESSPDRTSSSRAWAAARWLAYGAAIAGEAALRSSASRTSTTR